VKELVVISGKGGTGKTSVAACFAVLAERPVVADCDVDAADLHLVLAPRPQETHEFRGGREARIRPETCLRCGVCAEGCRFGAIVGDGPTADFECEEAAPPSACRLAGMALRVDPFSCEGCGVCQQICPVGAIDLIERVCGRWMISETRCGPMVHAHLNVGGENSGKLVSIVRKEARRIAESAGHPHIIVDGPPGVGCPAIASIVGASQVLIVTEPTVAGVHDLERVLSLCRHFGVPAAVSVNRWDLNPAMTTQAESAATQGGALVAGRIRYDPAVTQAQLQEQTTVELGGAAAEDVRRVWSNLCIPE